MSVTAYPTLRLKLTVPQALKLQFLPAIPGSNAAAAADRAEQAAQDAQTAADAAVAATANKVDKAGDVMTGFLQLNANPVANLQAATKQYVDSHVVAISDGDKGDITVSSGGTVWTVDNNAVTHLDVFTSTLKGVVPASGGGTANFLRADGSWNAPAGGGGSGNVSNSGTPTTGQVAEWTDATHVQGVSTYAKLASPVFTGDPQAPTPATADNDTSIATTAYVQANLANYQPLDADLTSLAAASGIGVLYYRSAANTWAVVTIGANLTFSGGTLAATAAPGAPIGAEYITSAADATLTAERVLVDTATVTWDRTTAGQIKATAAGSGTGVRFTAATTAPSSPTAGDFWYDLTTGVLTIRIDDGNSSQWVQVSPSGGAVTVLGAGLF